MSRDRIAIVGKWKLWLGAGILAASWGSPLAGEPPEPRGLEPRSLSQPWNRRWDELKEPRYVERGNHRFFEIRHRAITVIAPTAEQAREAAAEAGRAWEAMSQLASHLPAPYDRREFALGSITVMIDSEPLRERNRPETTLGLADEVGLVYVNVAPGEPPLEEQMSRLRQGTAQAFLHVAQLDRGMPGWAVSGLASFVDQQLELAGDRTEPRPALEGVNRRAWERIRAEQDRLGPMPSGGPPSETVQFLLQADDARRAVDFFDALAATTGQVKQPDRAFRTFGEEPQPEQVNEAWERLLPRDWESRLAAWREDPLAGQPLPEEKFAELPPELQLRGAEMGLLLKLARRLEEPVRGGIAPKIVGLDDAGRPADFSPPPGRPPPAPTP